MENSVLKAINRFELLKNSDNITVALSGGADSMALLHVLLSLRKKLGITVNAAHLNHMIRGDEAERDEMFVKSVCQNYGVELICERINIPDYALKHRLGIEQASREVRYDFLSRVCSGVVATAHTASDNLETMLFNLTRGASLKGLCGIPFKRGIYVRPLLLCTREDVEKYCSDNGIPFVTDSTNLCDNYTRNKIRHNVVPVLKSINPLVENSALRTALTLREDERFFELSADSYLSDNICADGSLDISLFEQIAPSVAKRVVKLYCDKLSGDINLDNKHICGIYSICLNGGRLSLPEKKSAVVLKNRLSVVSVCESSEPKQLYNVSIKQEINNYFTNNKKINNLLSKNLLDCDKIAGKYILRFRQPGDSIRLANRGCTKSLKKLFNECHIPVEERDCLPLLADEKGVIWICGIGVAQRCAVTDNSENVLVMDIKKVKE